MQTATHKKTAGNPICLFVMTLFFCMLTISGSGLAAPDITDTNIEIAVADELEKDQAVPSYLVDVECTKGIVTLTGSVNNLLAKERALAIAETVKGVRSVVNRIEVNPLTEKKDPDIRKDVIQSLAADPVTELFDIDVRVEHKVVTLKGTVNSYIEKQEAGRVAKAVSGVKEVENLIVFDHKTTRSDADFANDIEQALAWDTLVEDGLI